MTSDVWHEAQKAELVFHLEPSYRAQERKQRAFYAGMLEIVDVDPLLSIVDIGCGPQSLLLSHSDKAEGRRIAIDPLRFTDEDEAQYARCGITRLQVPAEDAAFDRVDEVWMYNCLQHVRDPQRVLDVALSACGRIRLFEWLHTPISIVHPHSLTQELLTDALESHGFVPERTTTGLAARTGEWRQQFYAGVWRR